MGQRRRREATVGEYRATYWPANYNSSTREYEYTPPRPSYRSALVQKCTDEKPHSDPYYASRGVKEKTWEIVLDLEARELTIKNSDSLSRIEQAKTLAHLGYGGPIGGGEARALRNLFESLGKADLVKRGWIVRDVNVLTPPTKYAIRQWRRANGATMPPKRLVPTQRLQNCYLFKSPLDGVHFSKFIRLARMYKDDSGKLRTAVEALLANPDAAKEIETLDAIELLAGMTGRE